MKILIKHALQADESSRTKRVFDVLNFLEVYLSEFLQHTVSMDKSQKVAGEWEHAFFALRLIYIDLETILN
jgi:hypothetical protein